MTKYQTGDEVADETQDGSLDRVADAIANERRRAVLSHLCRRPASTTELADVVGASLPTMHQHLDVLRAAGLISSTKRGRTVTHTVDLAPLSVVEDWVATRRSFWEHQLDALATAFDEGSS